MHYIPLLASLFAIHVCAEKITNNENFIVCNPSAIHTPNTTIQVQKIVTDALDRAGGARVSIRAFGAGHSTNRILCSDDDGITIITTRLSAIVAIDLVKREVTIGAGALLGPFLESMVSHGLMMVGVPDYGGISIAGALATSAHGSSLKYKSSVQDYVVGVKLVTGTGKIVTLVESDEDFKAVRGNLGVLGVITEVTMRMQPLKKVAAKNTVIDFKSVPDSIVGLISQHDFAGLYYFVENEVAILHAYDFVDVETKGDGYRTSWDAPVFGSVISGVAYAAIDLLQRAFSETEVCWLAGIRAWGLKTAEVSQSVGYFGNMYMGKICTGSSCVKPQVDDMEIAIPLARLPEALKDITLITRKTKTCFPLFGLYTRFGLASDSLIGPTRNGPVAYIEIHILRNRQGGPVLGMPGISEIRQLLLGKYGGQPHFGKNFPIDFSGLTTRNEKYPEFNKIALKYDKDAVFTNQFVRSFEVEYGKSVQQNSKACAVSETCLCESDMNCFEGWGCSQGAIYTPAKVCRKSKGTACHRNDECVSGKCYSASSGVCN